MVIRWRWLCILQSPKELCLAQDFFVLLVSMLCVLKGVHVCWSGEREKEKEKTGVVRVRGQLLRELPGTPAVR